MNPSTASSVKCRGSVRDKTAILYLQAQGFPFVPALSSPWDVIPVYHKGEEMGGRWRGVES